jgi:hypothetical protein
MRLIGANDPDRRWLLKNPSHLLNLEELLEVFDDALVIHTHRDPLTCFPSFWSLVSKRQQPFDGEHWRPQKTVERELDPWSAALNDSVEVRRRHPDRILDVYEDDIAAKPFETVAGVYDFVGQPLTREAERSLRAWIADNPKGKHGAHSYRLADFQITAGEAAERVRPIASAMASGCCR